MMSKEDLKFTAYMLAIVLTVIIAGIITKP